MKLVRPHFTSSDGYWRLLDAEWAKRETFIVVELDKFPAAGALEALWLCPARWCCYPIPMQNTTVVSPFPTLGCVKFDRSLMVEHPSLMRDAGELGGLGLPPEQAWSRLDLAVAGLLGHHLDCHWHEPGLVEHRHEELAVAGR